MRWLQMPKICTWTASKNKDKVLKLEFFSSWRTVWLTCTNKSEGCINKHQCDLQNISKIKQKFPSINNTLSGYEPALCFMNCGLFSGKQTMVPERWLRFLTFLLDHFHRDWFVYTQHSAESSMTKPSICDLTRSHNHYITQHQLREKENGFLILRLAYIMQD